MGPVFFDLNTAGPRYQALSEAIRTAIRERRLLSGQRLPGTRKFASDLGVSRNVVVAAIEQLSAEGYVVCKERSGTFVASDIPDLSPGGADRPPKSAFIAASMPRPTESANRIALAGHSARQLARHKQDLRIDFEYGLAVPDSRTTAQLKRIYGKVLSDSPFDYGDPAGDPDLRREIAKHLDQYRGLRVSPQRIILTNGSQQALDLCARLLLEVGDTAIIEDPCYQGAYQAFVAAGARAYPVPVDENGLNIERADRLIRKVKLIYVTPSHQFPTGVVMPLARRLALLNWAKKNGCYVVEDDYDSEFRYDCRPIETLAGLSGDGLVIYMGTFAKTLFPGLRIGFLVLPEALADTFLAAKWLTDRGNPLILQKLLTEFMRDGSYAQHVRRMNRKYAEKKQQLLIELKSAFGEDIRLSGTQAGTHIMATFTRIPDEKTADLVELCRQNGVGVYSANHYYQVRPEHAGLLFGISTVSAAQIPDGVRILAAQYQVVLNSVD